VLVQIANRCDALANSSRIQGESCTCLLETLPKKDIVSRDRIPRRRRSYCMLQRLDSSPTANDHALAQRRWTVCLW